MLFADLQFTDGAHHPVALDAADGGDLQRKVGTGDIGAGRAEHAEHARACVGGAANNLHGAIARVDGQHLKLVGLRVPLGRQDLRNTERGKGFGRIVEAFDLQPDRGQFVGDGLGVGIGVEMLLEPTQRKLHAPTPPLSVGTSSARKP